ncbi:MAG TPA: hypothetical protein VJN64_14275 [Terriglobales bacterium]|nr:hypothetical protein [Terriglobales bacterium]
MSKTHKDEHQQKGILRKLEVKRGDDTYDVFWNGERVRSRVQERWLNQELCVGFGFCGEEYDDILRQLNDCGKAIVVL